MPEWKSHTSDPDNISIKLSRVKVECDFISEQSVRNKSQFNQTDFTVIQEEIDTLL